MKVLNLYAGIGGNRKLWPKECKVAAVEFDEEIAQIYKDFLISEQKYDWIVTNIPFSRPKEFIFKMAENCIKGFGILCLANSMTATRLKKLQDMGLYLHSMTVLYIKEWGFGYRTDFYVFTRTKTNNLDVMIQEKTENFREVKNEINMGT